MQKLSNYFEQKTIKYLTSDQKKKEIPSTENNRLTFKFYSIVLLFFLIEKLKLFISNI